MKLQVQTQLDNRYRITAFLSQGGFGYTYLAEDLFGKKVCIKELYIKNWSTRGPGQEVITEDTCDFSFEHFSTRFWEEAKQLAAFDHPNIVKVKDFFRSNGTIYIVMEFIEGETLRSRKLKSGFDNVELLQSVISQLFDAVEELHRKETLHRDIKPDNILITKDDKVVLIDFGSARDFENGENTTFPILTPGYAPMEQYSSRAERGAFTDIYALGATLYFLLTGQKPLSAPDRYREQLPSPQQLNPSISTQLSSAVMMAMAMEPEDRFQTVADLKTAITKGTNEGETKNPSRVLPFFILIAIVLSGLNFFWPSSNVKPIDRNRLEKIIRANDLEKIVIINKERAEIYLKKASAEKDEYKKEIPKPSMGISANDPHYLHNIGNNEVFENRIFKLQDDIRTTAGNENYNIQMINEHREDWLNIINYLILPLTILIISILFVLRTKNKIKEVKYKP